MYQEIYHLYHHQPDPLELDALNDQAWLVNNSMTYSIVATIKAATPSTSICRAACEDARAEPACR